MPGSPHDLVADLRLALVGDGLRVVFQPECDLRTSEVLAVEALVRWRHPSRGELEPADFVGVAEEWDVIAELGSWVVEAALTEFAVWTAQLTDLDVVLRLNVSIAQLARPDFVDEIADSLLRHSVPASRVCIEITESTPRRDAGGLSDTIRGLRTLGIQIAIDDLANGYSTLSMLRSHPVDVIKIDRSLVSGIDTDRKAATIVAALLRLADDLELVVVAEGIETPGERDKILELGCLRGQGYLLSMPLTGIDMIKLLDERGRRTS